MSKSRFNRHKPWHAKLEPGVVLPNVTTRQRLRASDRAGAWGSMSGENALRDEHGIIPRRKRREMALALAKRKA